MLCSILRTFACVLIIQGGIYALRLNGPGGGGSSPGAGGVSSIGIGSGVNTPTNIGVGVGGTQHNTAANSNQMLNILSATQHAQHLHAGGSGSSSSGGGVGSGSLAHTFSKSMVGQLDSAGRLSQELADMAQLERERLMLLGLAKQTAAANAGTGHHGRPIITGRIQMSPVEEVESDYPSLLLQQARGPMYGSVVKQPSVIEDEYIDEEGEYGVHTRPEKYEYGHIVQPSDREEYGQPQRGDDLDVLIEAEPELDEMLTDLDSYQYLDELLPPEHRSMWSDDSPAHAVAGGNTRPHHLNDGLPLLLNPYRTLEELEESAPHTLQEIFEKEQHGGGGGLKEQRAQQVQQQAHEQQQQHQKHYPPQQQQHAFGGGIKHRSGAYAGGSAGGAENFNTHLQQKWQRKRSQQQQQQRQLQQWQRNIFGQQRQQLHHFGSNTERHNKFAFANSEATASKHIQPNNSNDNKLPSALIAMAPQQKSSSSTLLSADSGATIKSEQQQQKELKQTPMQQQVGKENIDDSASSTTAFAKAAAKLKAQQQTQQQQQQLHKQQQTPLQKQESFLHPNHKRSGGLGVGGGGAGNSMSAAAAAAANNGYSSIASQLMLRTARGQRQYDVPQIECPAAMDGMERFACPTPDLQGRYRCIDDHVLCDGFIDCPEGEDEDRRSCMFYKTVKAHLDVLADALLRWARGR
ncbi:PREDICTED: homeotic protein female sterile [Rhagoletis zephyria]|uniref:homeotic protein female sterile n=1 Tax=Rhagoletis zephyria TaxID=28612 RepID=UPI0008119F94|nr:PREDICTED: homeotic protein female sterile [Rhagoletis zephyria]